ncbi:hypothetical protein V5E97_04345 [Singulisphaera sp. Ch08]|uniref:Transposase n=1 Tax=Singulisphaera sp. Ch08 TaxID=3120278 RepID=A0AAU7CIA7_9BACT
MEPVQTPLTESELTSAVELLHRLIPKDDFPAYSLDVSPATVYTTLVTLWMLTLQRLGGGTSMASVIKEVLTNHKDLLPANKRVREARFPNDLVPTVMHGSVCLWRLSEPSPSASACP